MAQQYRIFTASGRIEICGNHTDHQRGRVLAAAVDLAARCEARPNGTQTARVESEGFGTAAVDLDDLAPRAGERDTPAALIRGVAAWFRAHGHAVGGFDGRVASSVPGGSGLSSSAAFEVLIGNVFKGLFDAGVTPLEIALAGQFAENVYFGKPCGLMDQCASSFGGLTAIDFKDPRNPIVTRVEADLAGYGICVVCTGGSHADLTPDYAAIPREMADAARYFGKDCLRDVSEQEIYDDMADLRAAAGDRAVLRAIHYFDDDARVARQAEALANGDMPLFLRLVRESGRSSLAHLQNVYSPRQEREQSLTLALAVSEKILGEAGACRVHGGGFAGTILSFVPDGLRDTYRARMERLFGAGACKFLNIRPYGGREETF